ncbi:Uncharacterised protein [Mycobacteroides abscessus subsp. abscessus]|nr:Uncharacterised protein [Mycobacteroides abscessus subsp. abscessus]
MHPPQIWELVNLFLPQPVSRRRGAQRTTDRDGIPYHRSTTGHRCAPLEVAEHRDRNHQFARAHQIAAHDRCLYQGRLRPDSLVELVEERDIGLRRSAHRHHEGRDPSAHCFYIRSILCYRFSADIRRR